MQFPGFSTAPVLWSRDHFPHFERSLLFLLLCVPGADVRWLEGLCSLTVGTDYQQRDTTYKGQISIRIRSVVRETLGNQGIWKLIFKGIDLSSKYLLPDMYFTVLYLVWPLWKKVWFLQVINPKITFRF